MTWDRESNEEYDDDYTRDSFERADEDKPDDGEAEYAEGQAAWNMGGGSNPYSERIEPDLWEAWQEGYEGARAAARAEFDDVPEDTPCIESGRDNCDWGTGEGRFHGRI